MALIPEVSSIIVFLDLRTSLINLKWEKYENHRINIKKTHEGSAAKVSLLVTQIINRVPTGLMEEIWCAKNISRSGKRRKGRIIEV